MHLRLNHHSGEPIWRQVVEQIKFLIAAGQIPSGEKLPSIRRVAGDLKINPRTVVKAYEELGHLGLVVLRQGQGVFVVGDTERTSSPRNVRRKVLQDMSRRLLAEGSRLGADPDEVLEVVKRVVEEMNDGNG